VTTWGNNDRGAVTVEAALGICSVVAVFVMVLTGICWMVQYLRCTDAAVEAARLVARGDGQRAGAAVARIAPAGATLNVMVRGDEISVEVRAPPLGDLAPRLTMSSQAFAVLEPGAGEQEQPP
jgi:hypothetical protein